MEPADSLQDIRIDALPAILNFNDEQAPILIETRQRIIDTVRRAGPGKAEAAAATYEQLAEKLLGEQLDESRRNAPADYYNQQIVKARGGLLINLARIWRDAGAPEKCLEALDRAINFAAQNRWASIVTTLENEKSKLQPSGT